VRVFEAVFTQSTFSDRLPIPRSGSHKQDIWKKSAIATLCSDKANYLRLQSNARINGSNKRLKF
jgi:hypothetical protein